MNPLRPTLLAALLAATGVAFAESPGKSPAHAPAPDSKPKAVATPPPRAPQPGVPFDDREIVRFLEIEGRKLHDAGKLTKLKLEPRTCSVPLAEPAAEKLPQTEIARRAEAATLIFGEFFRDPKSKKTEFSTAAGGFVINGSGACVTCLHVANEKGSRGLVAMTRDGRVFAVREALAIDAVNDVVVLQLDVPDDVKLPALSLAADPAPIGSHVAVMSHPDERFYMLTTGVVARHTVWRQPLGDEQFMAITADFAKGSSGCPVLDERGCVVGLVNNTESIYYDDDGKKKQVDLQMVVKNTTPSWVVRQLIR